MKTEASEDKSSWAQRLVLDQATRLVRAGDHGQREGAWAGGLALCALSAASAAEALPYAKKWMEACGSPGWVLARAAIDADSAVCLEALAGLGCIDPSKDLVWSGYSDASGNLVKKGDCADAAVSAGSTRCLEWLVDHAGAGGDLLAKAAQERRLGPLKSMLARLGSDKSKLGEALERACAYANGRGDSSRLSAAEALALLDDAGADWRFAPGNLSREWASWNGLRDNQRGSVWMPSLRLADEGEELPGGCFANGWADSGVFFEAWSAGSQLARSALEEGARGEAEKALARFYGKWELAKSEGALVAPIALLALGDPARTDSGLRRDLMDSASMIMGSPRLEEALADASVFGLAKSAIGGWLWGRSEAEGKLAWRRRPDALVEGLAARCAAIGAKPLGAKASREASARFVETLACFDHARAAMADKARARRFDLENQKVADAKNPDGEWAGLGRTLASWSQEMEQERKWAGVLASMMEPAVGACLVETVERATLDQDKKSSELLDAAKERAVLAVQTAGSAHDARNAPRL